ncbi:unnamed protein product [Symbiodinium sp. CCMP2592]|nr:unnamed protein product [Symbiodinium sp. CCMP2592]
MPRHGPALALVHSVPGPGPGIEDYNQVIHNLAKRTQWQQALAVLPQLEDQRLKASVVTYNTAITACVRGAQWKIAISFLHHLQSQRLANVITFSAALSSLDAASLWAHAMVLLASMEGFGVRRNSITYNAAISACANSESESWAAALGLLDALELGNTRTSIIPYNSATSACANGNWDLALTLVAGLGFRNLQADVVSRNALISVLEGRWQEALRPFSELSQASLQPTTVTFNSLLKVSATSAEWQRALLLLPEMELRELLADAVSFTTALSASARGLQWKTSLTLLREIKKQTAAPSVFAYNAALSACEGHGLWELALQLIAELSKDLQPDILTYSTGISACARSGAWQWALLLYSVLGRRDAQRSAVTCNSLIRACAKGGAWRRALALLAEARTQHTEVELIAYNACISACEKAAKWEQSLAVLRILDESPGLQADVISFNAAISACEKCEHWEEALWLLGELRVKSIEPSVITYNAVINACRGGGHRHALVDLLWDSEGLRGPDSFLWALAAAGVSEAEVIHEACVEVARSLSDGEEPGSFGALSRVLWSMETLSASSGQVCRSISRRLMKEIHSAELEEIAMVVWALVSGDADLSTAAAIQRRVESQLRQLRQTSPSRLIFHRLGISVMGIAGSLAMAGRLPRSFRASVHKALLQTGRDLDRSNVKLRTSLLRRPPSHDDTSATVLWDRPDRAVFFKPAGWEVYGAHTNLQMSSFAASHFGDLRILNDPGHNFGFLHRLDVPSSGLIAFGKTYAGFYDLQLQLHLGTFTREYTCLAHGWLAPSLTEIAAKVQFGTTGPTISGSRGKWSQTRLKLLGYMRHPVGAFSYLILRIVTGRKHQIRSHMAFVGHPTARDSYTSMETFGEDAALCHRNWLHRHLLSFRDQAGSSHEICSPLPQDLNHTFQTACTVRQIRKSIE